MNQDLLRIIIVLSATVVGTFGLTLYFGIERKHIIMAILSAVLCCGGYEVTALCNGGLFLSAFVGSALAAAYSDIMAHVLKVPATMMIIVGIVPLVPGARLYYTMLGVISSDLEMAAHQGQSALWLAAGIALGVISVTAISRPINAAISERLARNIKPKDLKDKNG